MMESYSEHGGELAVITGASSGIGLELAKLAARDGYSLLLVADRPLEEAEDETLAMGASRVKTILCDLSTSDGVTQLLAEIGDQSVELLIANAGHGLGGAFLDQEWDEARHVIDTNVVGTSALIHAVGRGMRDRGRGRILITGSIAGHIPGSFQAVYNGTKAYTDSLSYGLRNELKDSGVTVTCLMPGATDTEFFERAEMENTKVGRDEKADPAKVALDGYEAMMNGEAGVVSGFMNKIQMMFSGIIPETVLAQMHRRMAEPTS